MEKIRVFTAFSGYDSQCLSLDRLKKKYPEFDYELVGWSEIDKYAIQAHNAIYPQWADRNYGDITKVDWSLIKEPIDLLCYSTPCQSISNAGLQHGFKKGSGTRSSIIWSVLDAIEVLRPKFLLMENVAAMVSSKFINDYHSWCSAVSSYGYTNFAQVLNAKDYGIPQNRERIFLVSVLGDAWYNFPQPLKLEKRLKDVLETNVDEKYYLSEKMISCFENRTAIAKEKGNGFRFNPTDGGISRTVKTDDSLAVMEVLIIDDTFGFEAEPRMYNDVAPTLRSGRSGLKVLELSYNNEISPICCQSFRIRNLTPRECFRLMNVDENVIDTIQAAGISNSQQYKLAGNSIVVACLEKIFEQMFFPQYTNSRTLFG